MKNVSMVSTKIIKKPDRKVIIKRGIKADNYWDYCKEVGCDTWNQLSEMDSLDGEPICLWLTEKYVKPGTSIYVQGVEVDVDYNGLIPEGYDIIELPSCEYLMFQGEPFIEENFQEAIKSVQKVIKEYKFDFTGYCFDEENPQIQLEPKGYRGYIELKPVKKV